MTKVLLLGAAYLASATLVLDNERVRVFRTMEGSLTGVDHKPGVVVRLEDAENARSGDAWWTSDVAASHESGAGPLVIVVPKEIAAPLPPMANAGSKPGEATFTGMSFVPLFENDRVSVIRARMEVDAREGFHTHGSDVLVIHLSGGTIEDTAHGKTSVNRWKRGDVELEARGSSHSARNVGHAVDVVLVTLKP